MKERIRNAIAGAKALVDRYKASAAIVAGGTLFMLGLVTLGPSLHQRYIFNTVGKAVTAVVIPSNHESGGTGFNVQTPSGATVMLTNRHVCQLAENGFLEVSTAADPERYYRVAVREESRTTDLCITDAAPTVHSVKLAGSVKIGEQIGVLGHPLLEPNTLSMGMVTNLGSITLPSLFNISDERCAYFNGRNVEAPPLAKMFLGIESACFTEIKSFRTSAVTYPGNSGSPAVDILGNVVGVLFAGDSRTNYGFVIPLDDVKEFIKNY